MNKSSQYELFSPSGLRVSLSAWGASVCGVRMADRDGEFQNVALPPDGPADPSYAGAVLAPWAGRIAGGRLHLDGRTVQLACNEGENQLHGGEHACARSLWQTRGPVRTPSYEEIAFFCDAPDGLDGYPGNRRFGARYRLYADDRLELTLCARTDCDTRVNLSSHIYWNLSGDFSACIDGHLLAIAAQEVYLNDGQFLFCGRERPAGALDFSEARPVASPDWMHDPKIAGARGLNHLYVLRQPGFEMPAAMLCDPVSGRRVRLYTDQPCVLAYSGGFLPTQRSAIALEAQGHPLAACAPETPVLRAGESCRRTILFAFDIMARGAKERNPGKESGKTENCQNRPETVSSSQTTRLESNN